MVFAKRVVVGDVKALIHKAAKDGTRVLLSPPHDNGIVFVGGADVTVDQGYPVLRCRIDVTMVKDTELWAVVQAGSAELCVLVLE